MRTFLGWVIVAAVLAAIYAGVMFLPLYFANFGVLDSANSNFHSFKDLGVDRLRQAIVRDLNTEKFGSHEETDEEGNVVEKPGIGITEDDVAVEFDDNTKILHVHFEYSRKVVLKPTAKVKFVKFTYDRREKPPNVW